MKANNIPENNFISYKKLKNTQLTLNFLCGRMALLRETECKDVICDSLLRGREGATTFYSLPIVQHLSVKIQRRYCRNQETAPPIQPNSLTKSCHHLAQQRLPMQCAGNN